MISIFIGTRALPGGRASAAPAGSAPVSLAAPRLTGLTGEAARIGGVLGLDPGAWGGSPAPALSVQWRRNGVPVPGATGPVYHPLPEEDGARLEAEITAVNVHGSVRAVTASHRVAWPAPAASGSLPDQILTLDPGTKTVNTAFDFSGGGLSFRVSGNGVTIDPVTGLLTIDTTQLLDGIEIIVTASNSGGQATSRFRLTIAALPLAEAPSLVTAPGLAGPATVGVRLGLAAGSWEGAPAPVLAFQWLLDGVAIPGATGADYLPLAGDAGRVLSVRVTATNASGSLVAATPGIVVAPEPLKAPVATGVLEGIVLIHGGPAGTVEAAAAFTGRSLAFAVAGGGAGIDPATGRVTLPTGALRAAAAVTVTASNAAGSASAGFPVTVAPAVLPPAATAALPDLGLSAGQGLRTVSAQAAFTGAGLTYDLAAAPAGVTIDRASGLLTIDTGPAEAAGPAAAVTVRAANAAGTAEAGFALTLRPSASDFTAAAALGSLSFIGANAGLMSLTHDAAGGYTRLVTPASGRVHGNWAHAAGDGRIRVLARWTAPNPAGAPYSPFLLGARVSVDDGGNWRGLVLEALQPAAGSRRFRALAFTGSGSTTTSLAAIDAAWAWDTWYWVELETAGSSLRGRFYPETAPVPDWQLVAALPATAPASGGATGPAALPQGGQSPAIDLRRIAFEPLAETAPAVAAAADWTIRQINLQS